MGWKEDVEQLKVYLNDPGTDGAVIECALNVCLDMAIEHGLDFIDDPGDRLELGNKLDQARKAVMEDEDLYHRSDSIPWGKIAG